MIKNVSLGIAVMLMLTIGSVCAQTVGSNPAFEGWNCNDAAVPGFCTRTLQRGDIAWDWAGRLFNDTQLWRRFQEDNPEKTRVFERGGKTILQWSEGTTVRIRYGDLKAIAEGTTVVPEVPKTVGTEVAVTEYPWWLLLLAILAAAALALLALAAYRWSQGYRSSPAYLGPPQRRRDGRWVLNLEPYRGETERAFANRIMTSGRWDQIYRVTASGIFPTRYGDGIDRNAAARGETMYVGVAYAEDGSIAEARMAWAACLNESAQINARNARTIFNSNPTFSNATLLSNGNKRPNNWVLVERYLRAQFATAMQQDTVGDTAQQPEPVQQNGTAASHTASMTGDGLRVFGRIPLANGGFLETGDEGAKVLGTHTLDFNGMVIEIRADAPDLAFTPKKAAVSANGGSAA